MEKISLQECLFTIIPDLGKTSDDDLKGIYKIARNQLEEELERLVKNEVIESRFIKGADENYIPSDRKTLIKSVVNMYARMFLGRVYELQQEPEGDNAIKIYIGTGV